jgi:hypothetical protein
VKLLSDNILVLLCLLLWNAMDIICSLPATCRQPLLLSRFNTS